MFLLSLSCLHAQKKGETVVDKLLYEDRQYLHDMYHDSRNPVSIANSLWDIADFTLGYEHKQGSFHKINEGKNENLWNVGIQGTKKIGKMSFAGGVIYRNEKTGNRKWSNSLYIAGDNPFFIADSIASDYTAEKFRLHGGMSYKLSDKWQLALRAGYDVGNMADQTDPRPKTKGMRFHADAGFSYKINSTFSIGTSFSAERLRESISYYSVDHLNPKTNSIFLFRALGNPEVKEAYGYTRRYYGSDYSAQLQLLWDGTISNFLELNVLFQGEQAEDGSTDFSYKGGDYSANEYSVLNRTRFIAGSFIHNLTVEAGFKPVSGIWYIQTQTIDKDGNKIWTVRDKSISHTNDQLSASASYRFDLTKKSTPTFSSFFKASYYSSNINQYPELNYLRYSNLLFEGYLTKHLSFKKNMLSLSLTGNYGISPSKEIKADGYRLYETYLTPSFEALIADHYGAGAEISYKTPLKLKQNQFILNLFANTSINHYKGQSPLYKNTNRTYLYGGLSLIF